MQTKETVSIKRTCEATEIPSGRKLTIFEGTELILLQSLGGSFTVMTHQGQMASIAGKDADALGKEPPPAPAADANETKTLEEKIWAQLKTCYDPEIPHNIVDLGLIYGCQIYELEDGGHRIEIRMTLTAPGCGMGEWLRHDVHNKVMSVPDVKEANIEVVFDPPWDRSKMHPALRRELGY